jgi:hypothetical protein
MATGNLNISAVVSGGPDGARSFGPFTITTGTATTQTVSVALIVGSTTIPIPTGTTWAIFVPPNATAPGTPAPNPGYGGTITLKGVAGDTGVPVSVKWWSVWTFDSTTLPANIVVTATVSGTAYVEFG